MITKEYLEKLITNGDRVYFINNKEIHSIGLDKNWCFIDDEYLKWKPAVNKLLGNDYYSINDLYKTKEEAEWCLEFGNITRTETLSLPTWEEFITMVSNCEDFDFHTSKHKAVSMRVINRNYLVVESCFNRYYDNELTKENYIKACRVANDLFLGKEPKEEK